MLKETPPEKQNEIVKELVLELLVLSKYYEKNYANKSLDFYFWSSFRKKISKLIKKIIASIKKIKLDQKHQDILKKLVIKAEILLKYSATEQQLATHHASQLYNIKHYTKNFLLLIHHKLAINKFKYNTITKSLLKITILTWNSFKRYCTLRIVSLYKDRSWDNIIKFIKTYFAIIITKKTEILAILLYLIVAYPLYQIPSIKLPLFAFFGF